MEQEKEFIETRCNKHKFRIITRKDGTQYFEIIIKGDTKPTLIANVDRVVEDYVFIYNCIRMARGDKK